MFAIMAGIRPSLGATELEPPTIAVVDMQALLRDSEAARSIQEQLDAQREIYQREIGQQEEELRRAEQELAQQRTVLSPEAFAERRRDFERRMVELQRRAQEGKRALDKAYAESMTTVRDTLLQIIADVAAERNANIVLAKQQVVIVERSLDLTQQVMDRLNEALREVAVSIER